MPRSWPNRQRRRGAALPLPSSPRWQSRGPIHLQRRTPRWRQRRRAHWAGRRVASCARARRPPASTCQPGGRRSSLRRTRWRPVAVQSRWMLPCHRQLFPRKETAHQPRRQHRRPDSMTHQNPGPRSRKHVLLRAAFARPIAPSLPAGRAPGATRPPSSWTATRLHVAQQLDSLAPLTIASEGSDGGVEAGAKALVLDAAHLLRTDGVEQPHSHPPRSCRRALERGDSCGEGSGVRWRHSRFATEHTLEEVDRGLPLSRSPACLQRQVIMECLSVTLELLEERKRRPPLPASHVAHQLAGGRSGLCARSPGRRTERASREQQPSRLHRRRARSRRRPSRRAAHD
eukprot:scaffold73754_cov28-Tisochrysis_lutea.AAC.2